MLDIASAYIKGFEKVESGQENIKLEYEGGGEWDENVLHMSDLGYAYDLCDRQLWLRLNGYEKKPHHIGKRLMFYRGDLLHIEATKFIQLGLPDEYYILGVEKPVLGTINGTCDLLLTNRRTGDLIVVDYKTSRGGNFAYLDSQGAKESNVAQLQGYMEALDADYGILLYIDREGQNAVRQFFVDRDDEEVYKNQEHIMGIAMNDMPPILKPNMDIRINKSDNSIYLNQPWQCTHCDFYEVSCKGAMPKEFADVTTIVAKQSDNGEIYAYKDQYEPLVDIIKDMIKEE